MATITTLDTNPVPIDPAHVAGQQAAPVIAALKGSSVGGYVIAWDDVANAGRHAVYAQRYAADGTPVGDEINVGPVTSGAFNLGIAATATGGFVVTWNSTNDGTTTPSGHAVLGQIFDAVGAPVGSQIAVATNAEAPQVLALADGHIVFAWSTVYPSGSGTEYVHIYNANGSSASGDIQVSTSGDGYGPELVATVDGFTVTWLQTVGASSAADFYARYSPTGTVLTPATQFSAALPTADIYEAELASLTGGGSVAVWRATENGQDVIRAHMLDQHGTPTGTDLSLLAGASGTYSVPYVAPAADGGFVLYYSLFDFATFTTSLKLQAFSSTGVAVGTSVTVAPPVSGQRLVLYSQHEALAMLGNGDLVAAWGREVSPDGGDIFMRRYSYVTATPAASGSVTLTGTAGNDEFYLGAGLDASDHIDGLAGTNRVDLLGDYGGVHAVVLGATTLTNIQQLKLFAGYNYDLTTNDGNAVGGQVITVDASALAAANTLTFKGSAETNGSFIVTGGAGADVIIGGAGNDMLDGGAGIDKLYGGAGDDIYTVDQQGDLVFENANAGLDSVYSSANFYLYANLDNLVLTGTGNIFGVANELDNVLTGNAGNNTLIAGAGVDLVHGFAGADIIFGQDGNDFLSGDADNDYIAGGNGDDTIDGGTGGDSLYGEDGNDTLTGGTDFVFDQLVGGNGNDILHGDSGLADYDYLYGNAGDDSFYVDTGDDLTFEQPGEGTDTVYATVPGANNGVYLYANIENLVLLGTTAFGVGNVLDNIITGNAVGNTLLGGDGADTINGLAGNDILFGQAGADVFAFNHGTGVDTVGDFVPGTDRIDLRAIGYTTFAQVTAALHQNGSNTAIDLGGGDVVILNGVTTAQLHAADFILATSGSVNDPIAVQAVGVSAPEANAMLDGNGLHMATAPMNATPWFDIDY